MEWKTRKQALAWEGHEIINKSETKHVEDNGMVWLPALENHKVKIEKS